MLSCKEVTRKIASDELSGARWSQRMAIRLHLFLCRHCGAYAAQLRAIGVAARNLWPEDSENSGTLERLEGEILKGSLGGPSDSRETSRRKADNVDSH